MEEKRRSRGNPERKNYCRRYTEPLARVDNKSDDSTDSASENKSIELTYEKLLYMYEFSLTKKSRLFFNVLDHQRKQRALILLHDFCMANKHAELPDLETLVRGRL